ncbi:MAG: hypothetical protein JW908_08235 [Anaerolineales bacterium]|nr:hypothetical protein [Anaerolineales bacterium]
MSIKIIRDVWDFWVRELQRNIKESERCAMAINNRRVTSQGTLLRIFP